MKFKLSCGDLEELYYDQKDAVILSNDTVLETSSSLSLPFGSVDYKETSLSTATILQGDYAINKDIVLNSDLHVPCLEMHFNLSNTIRFGEDGLKSNDVNALEHNLLNLRSCRGFVEFEEDTNYRTFDIHLTPDFIYQWYGGNKMLDQFIEKMHADIPSQLYHGALPITMPMQTIINDVHNCPFKGITRKIYLEAKVQELFALQLDLCECMQNIGQKANTLSPYDIERIHEARDYIRNNMDTPCSIIELAHKVGTNDYKLKRGFKELFGTTVFGYLQETRMHKARKYLQDKATSIAEITELLGYQNQSAFTSAFKKYYGYPPSKLRK